MNPQEEINYLLSPQAVNDSSEKVFQYLESGGTHFRCDLNRLPDLAKYVAEVTRENYPELQVPYHSRWKHFEAGGTSRLNDLFVQLGSLSQEERARAEIDLTIISVLLDAGAGPLWSYLDSLTQKKVGRSEGLGLASFDAFFQGKFSNDMKEPFRVDAEKLVQFEAKELEQIFQVTAENSLHGFEGRLELLRSLGKLLIDGCAAGENARPSFVLESWKKLAEGKNLKASDVLSVLLREFSKIWPSRLCHYEVELGDTWHYPPFGPKEDFKSFVVFHKLSQWLSFSLLSPLERYGFHLRGVDQLSGLAEYRNGGLFVDFGVLMVNEKVDLNQEHCASSELVVEWRALTLALLRRLAPFVRKELKMESLELPKILEGGTWWAGRRLASEKRADASPPIKIKSDGTVF